MRITTAQAATGNPEFKRPQLRWKRDRNKGIGFESFGVILFNVIYIWTPILSGPSGTVIIAPDAVYSYQAPISMLKIVSD